MLKFITIITFIIITFSSVASHPDSIKTSTPRTYTVSTIDSIVSTSKSLIGKPYKAKSPSGTMMDCSGFIKYVWSVQNIKVSGSSRTIGSQSQKIDLADVQKGDFLFFTGRDKSSKTIGHISMVVEKTDSSLKMIHSCNRGVIIDNFPRSYYKERFLYAGRHQTISEFLQDDSLKIKNDTLTITEYVVEDSLKIEEDSIIVVESPKTVSIIGVGDMMIGTHFPSTKHLPPNDGKDIFTPVKDILQDADLTFGNLEGVILSGKGTVKKCSNPALCYAFKSPDHYVNYYKEAGFDVVSLANNHSGDFGSIGRNNTTEKLKEVGLEFAGTEPYPYSIFTKDSITYGFYAVSPNRGTIKINNYAFHKATIAHLDSLVDIVIVSFHGGAEGSKYTHITKKTETYLGENRGNPYEFSRVAIDAGADIVFGHGPHVTRAVDIYKDRFIAYSLGNFATYGRFSLTGVKGLAPIIKVNVTKEGVFVDAQITATKQTGEGGPKLDPENKVIKVIKTLTKSDIPNCELNITDDGKITKK